MQTKIPNIFAASLDEFATNYSILQNLSLKQTERVERIKSIHRSRWHDHEIPDNQKTFNKPTNIVGKLSFNARAANYKSALAAYETHSPPPTGGGLYICILLILNVYSTAIRCQHSLHSSPSNHYTINARFSNW